MFRTGMRKQKNGVVRPGRVGVHVVPVLVWLAAVAGVVVLLNHRSQRFEVLGIVQGRMHQISAPVDGRLKMIEVELFQDVQKGQQLAILDHSQIDAQIAGFEAEIENLASQMLTIEDTMQSEAANLQLDLAGTQRRLYADVENARLRILEQKAALESDKVLLVDLAMEVKAAKELLDSDSVARYELEKSETLYNALAAKIKANEDLLSEAEQELKSARQACDEFAQLHPVHPSTIKALEPLRKQIAVQEQYIADLTIQRQAMKLTSPVDGKVVQIQINANQTTLRRQGEDVLRNPGEVVLAGDPILVIAETEPREIVAYISSQQLSKVKETMEVQLIKNTEPAVIAASQITHLGPTMELAPQQLWRNPGIPEWGRPILIRIPSGMKLLPGETIGIRGI